MDYIALGKRIRRFRKKKRLTQEALAEQVGISASFVGHIERGSRIASLDTVMHLCRALEVTPNDLLGYDVTAMCSELPEQVAVSPDALLAEITEWLAKQKILQ